MREKKEAEKKDEKGKARVCVFVELYEKQLNSAAGSRNARRARSCIVVHFTRSFVAQRLRAHFTFLPKQKHFTFRRLICSLFAYIGNAEKFHVLRKGAQVRLMVIVPLRRTSGCSVTLPAQKFHSLCTLMPDRRL